MKKQNLKTAKRFAIGTAVAGAAGYLAGILTAPKSGKETRQDIKTATDKSIKQIEGELKNLQNQLGKVIDDAQLKADLIGNQAKSELSKLTDNAADAKEKVREILSSVQQGRLEDKDLKKAIADANKAIDHIRDYLKK